MTDGSASSDLWIHDETDRVKAGLLSRFFDNTKTEGHLPRPFGVFYTEARYCYEDALVDQITNTIAKSGKGDLDKLLKGSNTWTIA